MNKQGFTLAEILIVLGIIGVVAAMTLPVLMHSYRKHVIETQLKEFYSMFNHAIKLSEVDNEEIEGWDWPVHSFSTGGTSKYDWYVKYLQPYMKAATIKKSYHLWCVWYDGFAIDFINGTGAACGFFEGENSDKFICLFFPNGEKINNMTTANTDSKFIPGRDYFVFQIDRNSTKSKGLQPYDNDSCFQTIGTRLLPSPGCTKLIKENGWKIPADYPVKI